MPKIVSLNFPGDQAKFFKFCCFELVQIMLMDLNNGVTHRKRITTYTFISSKTFVGRHRAQPTKHTMTRGLSKVSARGHAAIRDAALRAAAKKHARNQAAEESAEEAGQQDFDDEETQRMEPEAAAEGEAAAEKSTVAKAGRDSAGSPPSSSAPASTPPTQDKTIARSLSKDFSKNDNGAKLQHERELQKKYESQVEELQKKLQELEGQVSSPAAGKLPQKRAHSTGSASKSPAKDPPLKKGGADVAAEPWKKVFQLAGANFCCICLPEPDCD